jgi:sugar phosphate isomerase/epimerase
MIRLATMSSVCPDWTLSETVAGMKRHGFEGYEPRVEWGHRAGVELTLSASDRAEVRKQFEDEGLKICCIATGCRFAMKEPEERAKNTETLKRYVDFAGDLGAPCIRVFGGAIPGGELYGVVKYAAEAIRPALDQARARGVTVLMETHDDWRRASQVRAVIQELQHPAFAALWDIMHTQRVFETPEESFAILGPHIRHLHLHEGRYSEDGLKLDTDVPLGEGVIDHATPFRLLMAAGFDGYASVEVIQKVGRGGRADEIMGQYAAGLRKLLTG